MKLIKLNLFTLIKNKNIALINDKSLDVDTLMLNFKKESNQFKNLKTYDYHSKTNNSFLLKAFNTKGTKQFYRKIQK